MASKPVAKKKKDIKIPLGILHVLTTSNNTLINLTTPTGDRVLGGGAGTQNFK